MSLETLEIDYEEKTAEQYTYEKSSNLISNQENAL